MRKKIQITLIGLVLFIATQLGTIFAAWIVSTQHISLNYLIGLVLFFCILIELFIKTAARLHLFSIPFRLKAIDFKYGFFCLVLMILSNHFVQLLFPAPISDNQKSLLIDLDASFLPVAIVILTAPLFEEIIFRGVIFDRLFRRSTKGLFVQGFLFTLPHILPDVLDHHLTVSTVCSYAIPAILFAWIDQRTRRLETSLVAHFLNNVIPLFIIVVAQFFHVSL